LKELVNTMVTVYVFVLYLAVSIISVLSFDIFSYNAGYQDTLIFSIILFLFWPAIWSYLIFIKSIKWTKIKIFK